VQGKAPAIIGLLVLFVLCMVIGYFFARFTDGSAPTNTSTLDLTSQRRLVIIQVDDLTAAEPQLDVVWLLAVSFSSSPQLNFRIIYPAEKDGEILSHFGISANQQPDQDFLPGIQQTFNLAKISDYILFDRVALQTLSIWLGTGEVPLQGANPGDYAIFHKALIPYGCDNAQAITEKVPPLEWSKLIGAKHLRTSLSFNDLGLLWDALIKIIGQLKCEITLY